MAGAFAEAVRATAQPCSFLLVVPAIVAILLARVRREALAAVLVATVAGGWWFAANRFVLNGWWLRASAVVVVVLIGVSLALSLASPERRAGLPGNHADRWAQAGIAGTIGLVATQWWRPCVGAELGAILTDAPDGLLGELPGMTAYMLGAMSPLVVIVLAARVVQPTERAVDVAAIAAGVVGVVIAGAIVFGRHDDVVVTLTRWTLE